MRPPIKYYGGKYYMTDIFQANFPKKYNRYVEVFGGSGSLLFAKNPEPNEVYNDLEKGVYSLYKCLSDKELFSQLKDRLDLTYYHSEIRKEAKRHVPNGNPVDNAFYFFLKNKMSFNGVGGFSRTFLLRRKINRSINDFLSSIDRLPEVHQRLSMVLIENDDWRVILKRYNEAATFMYLDPPYIKSTRQSTQRYEIDMTDADHEELVNTLLPLKAQVMLSGYENPIYNKLTDNGFRKITFPSPNAGSTSEENIWMNYEVC